LLVVAVAVVGVVAHAAELIAAFPASILHTEMREEGEDYVEGLRLLLQALGHIEARLKHMRDATRSGGRSLLDIHSHSGPVALVAALKVAAHILVLGSQILVASIGHGVLEDLVGDYIVPAHFSGRPDVRIPAADYFHVQLVLFARADLSPSALQARGPGGWPHHVPSLAAFPARLSPESYRTNYAFPQTLVCHTMALAGHQEAAHSRLVSQIYYHYVRGAVDFQRVAVEGHYMLPAGCWGEEAWHLDLELGSVPFVLQAEELFADTTAAECQNVAIPASSSGLDWVETLQNSPCGLVFGRSAGVQGSAVVEMARSRILSWSYGAMHESIRTWNWVELRLPPERCIVIIVARATLAAPNLQVWPLSTCCFLHCSSAGAPVAAALGALDST
jgi:hypothetical protein